MKNFAELSWQSRFTDKFPGDPEPRSFTRRVSNALYSRVAPTPVAEPRLIGWSAPLARELGIAKPGTASPDAAAASADLQMLGGNLVLPSQTPYAARYGGHQFGNWAGQLGDGRAIVLGEAETAAGRMEFQLKGAGPTPYSRRADGRAVLRSSLREFACSEAMHFLGIPTTRALSLVTTGEPVIRDILYDGHPAPEPGAIVCRVAPSFLRFGNFEILSDQNEHGLLRDLTDHLRETYYPQIAPGPNDRETYGRLLDEIARRTATLVMEWMRVGFVHGVMNTDNMSALGLTIDYGPYGWLEPFDPDWTPNTTDAATGRYRYEHQPGVAMWNLARLGEAWLPLIGDVERVHESLAVFRAQAIAENSRVWRSKLGLTTNASAGSDDLDSADAALISALHENLRREETDFTLFFRALSEWKLPEPRATAPAIGESFLAQVEPAFYASATDAREAWRAWAYRYWQRAELEGQVSQPVAAAQRSERMRAANPKYVLRNYLAQNAIDAATRDDFTVLERLMRVLESPYRDQPGAEDLAQRRPDWARDKPGCSALSCSS